MDYDKLYDIFKAKLEDEQPDPSDESKAKLEDEQNDAFLIRDMAVDDRPREKAMKHGIKSLSDAELMAIIFATGLKGKSVLQLSEEILRDNQHHLSVVARLTYRDLVRNYKGMGNAKAISLLAALELGARAASDAISISRPRVSNSQTAADLMRRHFANLTVEEFWLLLLSQSGKVMREIRISHGGVTATVVDIKVVLKHIVENLAPMVIVFHNHPSGSTTPSPEDDRLTRQLCEGARAVGSKINDHIIITDTAHYSYNDEGRLPS